MRLLRVILVSLLLAGGPFIGWAAESSSTVAEATGGEVSAAHGEHGLPQHAVEVGHLFGFPITNSRVVTWIVAVGLIVFAEVATRNMKEVPEGAQNFWEWMVESLHNFLEGIIGHHLVNQTFWFFATIFI